MRLEDVEALPGTAVGVTQLAVTDFGHFKVHSLGKLNEQGPFRNLILEGLPPEECLLLHVHNRHEYLPH
jgi:hypothetical protein